ncbi:Conidiation protein 6-domain-containing protein [Geopyxis carbonaria]|nr:Conidiation protein 6-domain-containing protein [Geopyxis carbonaria]
MDTKNTGNVIGGHKANIANPHTSEEAKKHSREVLDDIGDETMSSKQSGSMEGKNPGNVIGGYKATTKNPNVSKEAKEHAEKALEDMGAK